MIVIKVLVVLVLILISVDLIYIRINKRPLFVHFYFFKKSLSNSQRDFLSQKISLYNRLSVTQQKYFEHRVAYFIDDKEFISRGNQAITDDMKVWIAGTLMMLTFGMRRYKLPLLRRVIIYPEVYYSHLNKQMHKGEFNPGFKTIVFSWEDFVSGFDDMNDKINLGIHEFTHAIHLNSLKNKSSCSSQFLKGYKELLVLLSHPELKERIISSSFFRAYAYTNQFEFLAVVMETFIECPEDFSEQFPKLYSKIKEMLNFNYGGY